MADEPVLSVEDLHVEFRIEDGTVNAVNGLSYTVSAGETLAILGESGSGKSVSAQAVMGLIDSPPGFITEGALRYRGKDLLEMDENERRAIRGENIAMIFQDALSALNPVFSVGWQIGEMFRKHRRMSKKDATVEAIKAMERVKIPDAAQRVGSYPHEFSGGMRQRIMIAMALALEPDVLIADEPTTALDVTVQKKILDLIDTGHAAGDGRHLLSGGLVGHLSAERDGSAATVDHHVGEPGLDQLGLDIGRKVIATIEGQAPDQRHHDNGDYAGDDPPQPAGQATLGLLVVPSRGAAEHRVNFLWSTLQPILAFKPRTDVAFQATGQRRRTLRCR